MVYVFILWMLSFDEQERFLILAHLNLSIFSFMVCTFYVFNKFFPAWGHKDSFLYCL